MGGAGAGGPPPPAPDPGDSDGGGDSNVILTVVQNDDGSFEVYAGDEPEGAGEDMSDDDANAMGPGGDQNAPQGQHADSPGEVLKIAMGILNDATSGSGPGGGGGMDAQFAAGFGGPPGGGPGAAAGP
jgi:hypothetical protein